ncbi:hypothetical protein CURTO8I2_290015 [Curtobacterium sp. 8I-2]|nr:hypothetical protein CURTO8I2_290015 [Curtobacterium sp. 8I-2]
MPHEPANLAPCRAAILAHSGGDTAGNPRRRPAATRLAPWSHGFRICSSVRSATTPPTPR